VECKTSKAIVTASNGTRSETWTYFAVLDDVHPGDLFTFEQCDNVYTTIPPTAASACAAGSTCTTVGDAMPTGSSCYETNSGGFVGGKLMVYCGFRISSFDASEKELTRTDSRWTTVRLRH